MQKFSPPLKFWMKRQYMGNGCFLHQGYSLKYRKQARFSCRPDFQEGRVWQRFWGEWYDCEFALTLLPGDGEFESRQYLSYLWSREQNWQVAGMAFHSLLSIIVTSSQSWESVNSCTFRSMERTSFSVFSQSVTFDMIWWLQMSWRKRLVVIIGVNIKPHLEKIRLNK